MTRLSSFFAILVLLISQRMLLALPYQVDLEPPASGEDVFVTIEVPVGVTPSALTHGGVFDGENRLMKWGPLQVAGESTLGFELTAGAGSLTVISYPGDAVAQSSVTLQNDSDGDGLSNDFESTYAVTEPDVDDDGDGFSNLEEQNLGTNPRDASSRLFARSVLGNSAEETLTVRIPAEIGMAGLRVEASSSLTDTLWRSVPFLSRLDGDEIVVEIDLSGLSGGRNFFRVLR